MNDKALEDIKKFAVQRLQQEYGYCGVAESADYVEINSGNDPAADVLVVLRVRKND